MRFGPVPVDDGVGAISVHGVRLAGVSLRKGEVVQPAHVAALKAAGISAIVAARLEPGDVDENTAARRLAEAVLAPGLRAERAFTGRANLFATMAGVMQIDPALVDAMNAVDESLTLATLPPFRAVRTGEMVATVKVIPFAVPGAVLDMAYRAARRGPLRLAPFLPLRVGVVSTLLPSLKASVVDKTLKVLADRLAPAGAAVEREERVAHEAGALASALARVVGISDIAIVFGASAIADRRDVIPAAIEAAGGTVRHFGMPVDPGNLLLLGSLHGKPVIGAPGCARSPKENGFDWVLQRLLAGLDVTPEDIRGLGAGGLLMEIVSRPQPRLGDADEALEAAVELLS